ncbi:MAG: V-type ATP synthase subunit A, partial [Ruminococcus sp.]
MENNVIFGINGPVVTVQGPTDFEMMEMVYVGKDNLVGEIIGITSELTTIQVYEETTGLKPGDPIRGTGAPMNVLLGPGIIDNIFDGIERPLKAIEEQSGAFISRGSQVNSLDDTKLWNVTLKVKVGDTVKGGQIYATLPETPIIEHRLMVPPAISGKITMVKPDGEYKLFDVIAVVEDESGNEHNLTLCQKWPIRTSRPIA